MTWAGGLAATIAWAEMASWESTRASTARRSEQLGQRPALVEELERPALAIDGVPVGDGHGMIDRMGNVLGPDRAVGRVLAAAVAGAVDLSAANAAAGQQH